MLDIIAIIVDVCVVLCVRAIQHSICMNNGYYSIDSLLFCSFFSLPLSISLSLFPSHSLFLSHIFAHFRAYNCAQMCSVSIKVFRMDSRLLRLLYVHRTPSFFKYSLWFGQKFCRHSNNGPQHTWLFAIINLPYDTLKRFYYILVFRCFLLCAFSIALLDYNCLISRPIKGL